jgi:hypothetical protein
MPEIDLSRGKVAIVDESVYKELKEYSWYADKSQNKSREVYYARGKINGKPVYMHRYIIKAKNGMVVDHINGNTLDNRKENLREVTQRANLQNKIIKRTSKYPGVCYDSHNKRWKARIDINGKEIHLGAFKDEKQAAKCYQDALKRYGLA